MVESPGAPEGNIGKNHLYELWSQNMGLVGRYAPQAQGIKFEPLVAGQPEDTGIIKAFFGGRTPVYPTGILWKSVTAVDHAVLNSIPSSDLVVTEAATDTQNGYVVLTKENPDPKNPLRAYRLLEGLYAVQSQARRRPLLDDTDRYEKDYLEQVLGSNIFYVQGFDARPKNAPREPFIDSFDQYVGMYVSLAIGAMLDEYKPKKPEERKLRSKRGNTFLSIAVDYACILDDLFEKLDMSRDEVISFYLNSDLAGFLKALEGKQERLAGLLLATTKEQIQISRNDPKKTLYNRRGEHPLQLRNLLDRHLDSSK